MLIPQIMEDMDIPSMSSGPVGSRFVSETELDQAKANREAQWKAAYARLVSQCLAFSHSLLCFRMDVSYPVSPWILFSVELLDHLIG